jgi:hypothetical protein
MVAYTVPMAGDSPRVRRQKQKASSAAREMLNARYSYSKLERTLSANFDDGDLFVTLTYDDDHLPPNRDMAVRKVRSYLSKLRKRRKEKGQPLKYIYVTEGNYPGGRLHHHLVLNGTGDDAEDLRDLWIYGDSVKFATLKFTATDTYEDLASYLTKEPREHGHPEVGERTWTPSLGLTKPEEPPPEIVPDYVTLTPPPGAIWASMEGPKRNGFGEYVWLKYLLPYDPDKGKPKPKRKRRKK